MLTRIFWYHVVGICPVKCQMMRKRTHFSICMLYERYKFCECALDICTSHECTRIEFFSCISVVKITLKCVSANIKVLIHFFFHIPYFHLFLCSISPSPLQFDNRWRLIMWSHFFLPVFVLLLFSTQLLGKRSPGQYISIEHYLITSS